ncbi:sigma-54 dependent transcriptional regulator [Azoarcus olearius]|uniref:Probable transcriptional regulatory protein n=1 Tax=Azoarcus sp. (strain BH72) TaxID=418699 RepID=A1K9Z2_AZOSB|nr:sigma-54 dependent transcriptional regulator [Azoarcus olearius]CAL95647.1 probable transcriptional regulatory protein [Azoarcus olearius]
MVVRRGVLLDHGGEVAQALARLQLTGWEFQPVSSLEAARKLLAAEAPPVGVVVFDGEDAWPARDLEALLARFNVEWIAVLHRELFDSERLVPLLRRNFYDFHSLPLDRERLLVTLGHAYGKAMLGPKPVPHLGAEGAFGMTGRSPRMLQLFRQIEKVITVDAPVLIGGASGTGKELVAHAIHQHSARAKGPFIAMNCGAIPANLIHSELFGYERGAFTGAVQRKFGNIEAANNGVLFLDEIGDLPLDLQASLLRFLQEKTIVRVGGTERLRMNVRVIAATHVDLKRAVAEGRFREDLYYRLNVLHLPVPALRERREDISLLAQAVYAAHEDQRSPQVRGFSAEATLAMEAYDWPGNVRELINRVQQAMIMSENRFISAADLGLPMPEGAAPTTLDEARASVEREMIETRLRKCQNNVSETARQLGISRVTLYRMIDRLKIVL